MLHRPVELAALIKTYGPSWKKFLLSSTCLVENRHYFAVLCFGILLLSSETKPLAPAVGFTVFPSTISRALVFPYSLPLASSSGESEAPLSDMPANSPEARP